MNILRDWSQWGSALVMDIKGELYAHTARYFDQVYRLDLENPCYSDLWNPLPACLGNGELAHSIASIVVGYETGEHEGQRRHALLDLRRKLL